MAITPITLLNFCLWAGLIIFLTNRMQWKGRLYEVLQLLSRTLKMLSFRLKLPMFAEAKLHKPAASGTIDDSLS